MRGPVGGGLRRSPWNKPSGPVLVRSEAGFHVLSLPHREKVIVGELAENDCREFAAAVRAAPPAPGGDENDWRSECWLEEASHEPAALRDILERAKADRTSWCAASCRDPAPGPAPDGTALTADPGML